MLILTTKNVILVNVFYILYVFAMMTIYVTVLICSMRFSIKMFGAQKGFLFTWCTLVVLKFSVMENLNMTLKYAILSQEIVDKSHCDFRYFHAISEMLWVLKIPKFCVIIIYYQLNGIQNVQNIKFYVD